MDLEHKLSLTTSKDDWKIIRECYVNSFRHYSLYKYMVPDPSKRDDFLRVYLDANYDVTVGSGQGILIKLTVNEGGEKIIGGLVCVPPSSDGCGWAIGNDEPYWEAYEKHGLAKISPDGLERVKRYEAWENQMIAKKLSATRIPMWNGLFCAIDLDYTAKGLGSGVYQETVGIVAEYWSKMNARKLSERSNVKQPVNLIERARKQRVFDTRRNSAPEQRESECNLGRIFKSLSLKQVHIAGTPKSRVVPAEVQEDRTATSKPTTLVVAITHSTRASHFHAINGFQSVVKLPFCDENNAVLFYTHVLVLDPFRTGNRTGLEEALSENGVAVNHGANGVAAPI